MINYMESIRALFLEGTSIILAQFAANEKLAMAFSAKSAFQLIKAWRDLFELENI